MCQTDGCRKSNAPKNRYCYSCIQQKKKNKDPVKYAYWTLRNNCKRRGVVFGLSLRQFKMFCVKTDYMNGKGKTGLHIDRKKQEGGYFAGNIQALPADKNIKKYWKWYQDEQGKSKFKVEQKQELDEQEYPF